ncbi:RNA polymerase sigma24 factor [Actinoplanes cyaneus]|uniref:RNA polymerase sigma24 factor n=1 Tax=Actinoplanes cyaneus TaxID=52696 RepID=A0A919M1Q1_9ACTN|nr:sigma-70 family RNA polymerase sigma factor [Actinoplanes cyaneus]MCW2135987.1 RNA polymerase sigma-70 factor, ECF subfamily [Actinoplanes cyaneus]GID62647.1 RNA polymerase sigma24 factor [Actinoplanes cyaneus]
MSHSSTASNAVADLFRDCYARLVGTVALAADSRADAEDCVQEAFLKAFDRWDHVSQLESPEVWVRTVALRLLSNRRRNARNGLKVLLRHGPPTVEPAPEPDHVDIARALQRMPVGQRQVVVMHYLLGLGTDEIAQELRIAAGTVKSRLSRARTVLGPLLREESFHV